MNLLAQLQKSLEMMEKVPWLPYKDFPLFFVGEDEKFKIVNEYLALGNEARNKWPFTVTALIIAIKALEHICNDGGEPELVAGRTLAKIKEILEGK